MDDLFLIGGFSKESGVSKRMLRHFDQLGLLKPDIVDDTNGYRYYDKEQLNTVRKILYLQQLGLTLKEIQTLSQSEMTLDAFLNLLKDKEANLRISIDHNVSYLAKIQHCIEFLSLRNQDDSHVSLKSLNESLVEKGSITMYKSNDFDAILTSLKNLPSQTVFYDTGTTLLEAHQGKEFCFLTFDLDKFAAINDDFGFDVGDRVIYTYYNLLLESFESVLNKDTALLSRLGGDEFALLFIDEDDTLIEECATNMIKSVYDYDFTVIGCERKMSCSCGMAKGSVNSIRALRHESTKAIMDAKRNGKNQLKVSVLSS